MPTLRTAALTVSLLAGALPASAACAQPVSAADVTAMREEIAALRAEVAALRAERAPPLATAGGVEPGPADGHAPPPVDARAAMVPTELAAAPRLTVSGDVRLRVEGNFDNPDAERERASVRARLRGEYAVTDRLTAGAQLTTGDPDDPNSADVTLSEFDDDFEVALDRAYLQYEAGGLTLTGGKFANPFVATDLVWDGDVSPQGLAAKYERELGGTTLRLSGLYFLVDEAVGGDDSDMLGGQIAVIAPVGESLDLEASLGFYNYELRSVVGADESDFGTNRLRPDGRYLSDFDLLDVIVAAEWNGLSEAWPLRASVDIVRNLGAAGSDDTAFAIDLHAGRTETAGEWRLGYGYAEAERDAVLTAFSQDNLTLGSNYRSHALTVDHALSEDIVLNATLYRFRELVGPSDDWLNRLRVSINAEF